MSTPPSPCPRPHPHPHRRLLAGMTLLLATATSGCGDRGYTFNTTAIYDLTSLGLRADITASGTVPRGADLSQDGTTRILLTRLAEPGVPFATLQTSNGVTSVPSGQTITYTIRTNPPVTLPWGSISAEESFRRILDDIGVTNRIPAVVEEALSVFHGPALGPKSTPVGSSPNVRTVRIRRNFKR